MYSANQVRQLYVVNTGHKLNINVHPSVDHLGENLLTLDYDFDSSTGHGKQLTDIIEHADIRKVTAKAFPDLQARVATITFNAVPTNSTTYPFEAYFTIVAPGFYGDTGENSEVFPIGLSFAANTSLATVIYDFASEINTNKNLNKYFKATSTATTLTITEVFDTAAARLGVYQLHSVPFIVENGHYVDLSVTDHLSPLYTPDLFSSATPVAYSKSTTAADNVNGSYELAQLEWFCHGFRGDVYREKAFPNNFPYKGLITPSQSASYWTCDVHYFWHGYGNQVDKSEKVLTFAGSEADMEAIAAMLTDPSTNADTSNVTSNI